MATLVFRANAVSGDEAGDSAPASIETVAWIAGHWGQERPGGLLEEIWSKPQGDSMMGVFRWIKKGKVWIYEILTIREEEGTLVLRFRHFSDKLSTWEPKDEPITYRLTKATDREAIFENPESDKFRRFAFRLDGDDMVVSVGSFRDGKVSSSEFRYSRQ